MEGMYLTKQRRMKKQIVETLLSNLLTYHLHFHVYPLLVLPLYRCDQHRSVTQKGNVGPPTRLQYVLGLWTSLQKIIRN